MKAYITITLLVVFLVYSMAVGVNAIRFLRTRTILLR